ncbi:MAG: NADH-quinone oxidoreductase subunit H [Spirochaetes bacterium]|nr:MAG: NADH-quinone oxidoreductase subunit H [Spirochaetota bacterium]RKX95674.1 MAG: NADH-quinone oxidoreductase subunit H [Spirochaetota bacterium]
MTILGQIGAAAFSVFIFINYGFLLAGSMARIRARVQGRIGQPVYQPYIDILKNNARRTAVHHGVMFFLGPVFRLAGGLGTFLFIPAILNSPLFANFSFSGDILLVMYFIFFGQLGMALGAGQSGHPYSPIGVSRGLAQMSAFEMPFILSVLALAIKHNSLSITAIVQAQQGGIANWSMITNPLAVIAAIIAFLGMSMHNPFSVVIAPQEIPIGPPTEYHSGLLGMLQTNRSIFNAAKLVLYVNLFFGGASATEGVLYALSASVLHAVPVWLGVTLGVVTMVIKTFLLYFITVFVGVSFPRFRTDQSIRFFLFVPTLIGLAGLILARL